MFFKHKLDTGQPYNSTIDLILNSVFKAVKSEPSDVPHPSTAADGTRLTACGNICDIRHDTDGNLTK